VPAPSAMAQAWEGVVTLVTPGADLAARAELRRVSLMLARRRESPRRSAEPDAREKAPRHRRPRRWCQCAGRRSVGKSHHNGIPELDSLLGGGLRQEILWSSPVMSAWASQRSRWP
jgi:hypothetical protein